MATRLEAVEHDGLRRSPLDWGAGCRCWPWDRVKAVRSGTGHRPASNNSNGLVAMAKELVSAGYSRGARCRIIGEVQIQDRALHELKLKVGGFRRTLRFC